MNYEDELEDDEKTLLLSRLDTLGRETYGLTLCATQLLKRKLNRA